MLALISVEAHFDVDTNLVSNHNTPLTIAVVSVCVPRLCTLANCDIAGCSGTRGVWYVAYLSHGREIFSPYAFDNTVSVLGMKRLDFVVQSRLTDLLSSLCIYGSPDENICRVELAEGKPHKLLF